MISGIKKWGKRGWRKVGKSIEKNKSKRIL